MTGSSGRGFSRPQRGPDTVVATRTALSNCAADVGGCEDPGHRSALTRRGRAGAKRSGVVQYAEGEQGADNFLFRDDHSDALHGVLSHSDLSAKTIRK